MVIIEVGSFAMSRSASGSGGSGGVASGGGNDNRGQARAATDALVNNRTNTVAGTAIPTINNADMVLNHMRSKQNIHSPTDSLKETVDRAQRALRNASSQGGRSTGCQESTSKDEDEEELEVVSDVLTYYSLLLLTYTFTTCR